MIIFIRVQGKNREHLTGERNKDSLLGRAITDNSFHDANNIKTSN